MSLIKDVGAVMLATPLDHVGMESARVVESVHRNHRFAGIRRQLAARKRSIEKRIDKTRHIGASPVLSATNIHYEFADRTQAISAGGIGLIHQLVHQLGLDQAINRQLSLFKIYLPYSESDHVLNVAYNLLAGGTCLEHLELRRNDEVHLNALGAERIPDPTTAGVLLTALDLTWQIHGGLGVVRPLPGIMEHEMVGQ